jgi:hypothetical protein
MTTTALAPRDAERLADLEVTIAQGLTTFVEVGRALAEIQENRLYREKYATFSDYCLAKFQMNRAHAYRLIEAATVIGNLSPTGDTESAEPIGLLPTSERQTRPLASLPPETQREVWTEAVATAPEGKAPTAAHVAATVERVTKPLFIDPPAKSTPVIPIDKNRPQSIAEKSAELIREEEKSGYSVVMNFINHPSDTPLTLEQVCEFYADPHFDPVVLPRIDRIARNFELLCSHRLAGGSHVSA